ncbi:MAG: redox-sensing transcriptional repressor Rex [Victivallales bacterium]|nr:redox-sensing transcriptional repressor Rex [Victivallales bacterium]
MKRHQVLNSPSIRRMPVYYHRLMVLQEKGDVSVSAASLASFIGMDTILVRKDLELTGVAGGRGVGYKIDELLEGIRSYLGWDKWLPACLIGAGALGTALLGFHEFAEYGLNIREVFDNSPDKIGKEIFGRQVRDVSELPEVLARGKIEMAILCVPVPVAQTIADTVVAGGIQLIWNFSNTCLAVPPDVIVQRELIAGGYAVLSRKRKQHVNLPTV